MALLGELIFGIRLYAFGSLSKVTWFPMGDHLLNVTNWHSLTASVFMVMIWKIIGSNRVMSEILCSISVAQWCEP